MQKTRVHEDGGKHAIWNQKIIFKYIGENKILVQFEQQYIEWQPYWS